MQRDDVTAAFLWAAGGRPGGEGGRDTAGGDGREYRGAGGGEEEGARKEGCLRLRPRTARTDGEGRRDEWAAPAGTGLLLPASDGNIPSRRWSLTEDTRSCPGCMNWISCREQGCRGAIRQFSLPHPDHDEPQVGKTIPIQDCKRNRPELFSLPGIPITGRQEP